ncbi:MAG TPA: type II toxin-antitoxin system HicA family toxin [Thermoanaerobaculia bacterium]|nr:type II toxin-antitoxin system HicA family toxin [Thermoanaerobaculia bacterium]
MSPSLPSVTARELTRALERAGFVLRRQRGSHQIYQHIQTGQRVSVPVHTGDIPKGTLRQILRLADLSVERFLDLLRGV